MKSKKKKEKEERREGELFVSEEVVGLVADVSGTVAAARALLVENTPGEVAALFRQVQPAITAEALREAQNLIGSYTTRISGSRAMARNVNVIRAAENINGVVVQPGEVFSTNHHFGPMTLANGYRDAPVIVGGSFEEGIGGGVCQISSTLYMALLFAELEIVERRNHSLRVGYVGWAMDATLAGDWIDLRWRNNTDHPVFVEAFVAENGEVVVNLYGYEGRPAGRELSFSSEHVESIAPGETLVEDPELAPGERVVQTAGTTGQRYALYKIVKQDGAQVDRVRVNTSTYRAVNAVVRVGSGGAEAASPSDSSDIGASATSDSSFASTVVSDGSSNANNTDTAVSEVVATPPVVEQASPEPAPAPAAVEASDTVELPDLSGWLSAPPNTQN